MKSIEGKANGFELSGPYENWKKLIKVKLEIIKSMMGGDLDLDRDMSKKEIYKASEKGRSSRLGSRNGISRRKIRLKIFLPDNEMMKTNQMRYWDEMDICFTRSCLCEWSSKRVLRSSCDHAFIFTDEKWYSLDI